jgi:GNAT superfamily N-acetyltransferase
MRITIADVSKPEVEAAIKWLQSHTFAADEQLDISTGHWWIARNENNEPVAFAALLPVPSFPGAAYMARCGVITTYRGKGLQRKLLLKREKFARASGYKHVITTTYNNPPSANNLIARGFKTYLPQAKWGAVDTIYWLKELA